MPSKLHSGGPSLTRRPACWGPLCGHRRLLRQHRPGVPLRPKPGHGVPQEGAHPVLPGLHQPEVAHPGGWVTETPAHPFVSLVTGERNGNNMARVAIYDIMEDYHGSIGLRAPAYQWVDDLTAKSVGSAESVKSSLI